MFAVVRMYLAGYDVDDRPFCVFAKQLSPAACVAVLSPARIGGAFSMRRTTAATCRHASGDGITPAMSPP